MLTSRKQFSTTMLLPVSSFWTFDDLVSVAECNSGGWFTFSEKTLPSDFSGDRAQCPRQAHHRQRGVSPGSGLLPTAVFDTIILQSYVVELGETAVARCRTFEYMWQSERTVQLSSRQGVGPRLSTIGSLEELVIILVANWDGIT